MFSAEVQTLGMRVADFNALSSSNNNIFYACRLVLSRILTVDTELVLNLCILRKRDAIEYALYDGIDSHILGLGLIRQ